MLLCTFSYEKLIDKDTLKKHRFNAVVHSSDLPKGKGWSPLTWQILEGKNRIVNTLFEVNESIDGGPILDKNYVEFEGFELLDEIRDRQAKAIAELCLKLIENLPEMNQNKIGQKGKDSFYRRRLPNDSKIDPNKSLSEEFNLLRVVDNKRYPAFFYHKGRRYIIKIFRDS
jgi:methionyl-tRNA formyltransferase